MTDPDELTEILQVVERRLRPTREERDRARAAMRQELRQQRSGDAPPLATTTEPGDGKAAELDLLHLDDDGRSVGNGRGKHALMLVAASIVVVSLIAVTVLIGQGRSELATDVGPPTTRDSTGSSTTAPPITQPATALKADQLNTVLTADRYSVVLDGTSVAFDLIAGQELVAVEDDRIRIIAADAGTGPSPKDLTIAILRQPFDGEDSASWLQTNDVDAFEHFTAVGGERAVDYELELSSPSCDPLAPCIDIIHQRAAEPTDAPLTLIEGSNRLLVLELSSDRSLVVLDTSGGNRSGPSQQRYNALVASLELSNP